MDIRKGFEKLQVAVGAKEAAPKTMFDELDDKCTLSRTARMYGFGICFGVGLLLSILSSFVIARPTKFAVLYTFGNILSICSTAFLMGPMRQVRNMFANKRIVATCIFLFMMMMTLISAIKFKSIVACLLFIILQFMSFVWYCASYIPGGQAILSAMCKGFFKVGE